MMRPLSQTMPAVLAALAVVACVAPPPIETPDIGIDVPDGWVSGQPIPGTVGGRWWERFEEPTIDAIVSEALVANHDLRAAAARLQRATADARIAGADLSPQIGLGLDGLRERQNFIGFPFPGGGSGGGGVAHSTFTQFGLSLNLSWEIDLWGRLRAIGSAALADVQAVQAEFAGAHLSLAAQASKGWFAVVEARTQVRLAEQTVASYRDSYEEVKDRVELGVTSQVDLKLVAADLATAGALLEQRQVVLERQLRQLEVLLGRYPNGAVETAADLPALPGPVPTGLPSELIARRPDIAAAERRLAAARARVGAADAAMLPRLSLTASGGTTSDDLGDLLDGDFRVWSLGANLLQPIFEGGRLRAQADGAVAEADEAFELYANTVLAALAEVEIALAAEAPLRRQEERFATAVEEASASLTLAEDRYRQGVEGFLTVLDARRRVFQNESNRIAVRRQRLETRVDLHLALGGGFELEVRPERGSPARANMGARQQGVETQLNPPIRRGFATRLTGVVAGRSPALPFSAGPLDSEPQPSAARPEHGDSDD